MNLDLGLSESKNRDPVNYELAEEQFKKYEEILKNNGWYVKKLKDLPYHPDGVFVEDNVVFYKGTGVVMRPGAVERQGEVIGLTQELKDIFDCDVFDIQDPATIDGGDVLKIDDLILVGKSSRTNDQGW